MEIKWLNVWSETVDRMIYNTVAKQKKEQPAICGIMIWTTSHVIPYQLRDVYSICKCYWNVATVIHRLLFSVEIQCYY